jgi:hypothetical protein
MCDPTLIIAATAATAIGSIYTGVAQAGQYRKAAAINDANAATAITNAANARAAGTVNMSRVSRRGRQQGGRIRAAAAKGNVLVDQDNPLDAQVDNALNVALNALDEGYKAEINAQSQEGRARDFRAQASMQRSAAKSSIVSGLFGAAGAAAAGGYAAYDAGLIGSGGFGTSLLNTTQSTV